MSVNWSWKHKMGEVSVERYMPGRKPLRFKLNIYSANCIGAIIHEFKEKDNDGKVHDMYNFFGFWNDMDHLKRCLGLKPNYDGELSNLYMEPDGGIWTKLKLNVYYKDMIKVAECFAKAGHKVELYYKEPKENK